MTIDSGRVTAIERALQILDLIGSTEDTSTVAAVAMRTELPKSSVNRIVQTLKSSGLLVYDVGGGRYRLGPRVIQLGMQAMASRNIHSIRDAARPMIERLARATGETAALTIRVDQARMYIDKVESSQMLKVAPALGQRLPLTVGGPGRALIYPLEDRAILDLLQSVEELSDVQWDGRPQPAHEEVWTRISEARDFGAAIARNEVIPGLASISVPVFNGSGGVPAALSLLGPSERLEFDDLIALRPALQEAARSLTHSPALL